jgi:hypothetical protein
MADLKPLGSERLAGQDKLNRIMEIARFNEAMPKVINETAKSEYSVSLADGNNYQIVRERQGYIIKKTISESETDYIEPMKNRKYYSSYSQALKRLNLVAGELNRINENDEGVSLYGEQKKFTLKTPKPAQEEMPAPVAEVPAAPPAVPSPELPPSPEGEEVDMDIEGEEMGPEGEEMDFDMGVDVDNEKSQEDTDEVTFKTIQKLTGKLTQKIRVLDSQEGMTSEDMKYVINMVLSSLDLKSLSEEDKEDILSKFEEDSENLGGDDMDGEDMTDDTEVEDIQSDMDVEMEGEMGEQIYGSFKDDEWYDQDDRSHDSNNFDFDYDEEEFEDFPSLMAKHGNKHKWFGNDKEGENLFNKYKDYHNRPFKVRTKKSKEMEESGHGSILDSIFKESKVDKVISKYFEPSLSEINESVKRKKLKVNVVMESVVKMTQTLEQELAAKQFLEENNSFNFVGITNKKNLVFENKGKQVRISTEGFIL